MDLGNTQPDLLLRLLSASSLRAKVLAGNIANQNVPGYKRQEVRFEELLQTELTHRKPDFDRVAPQVITDTETEARPDGNNVNAETEETAMLENRLLYELYATILNSRMQMMGRAIRGDR